MKSFFYSTAMLVGAIIGVGVFGIPYVSSRAGFWVGEAYIGGLLFLVLVLHLCYGEIVERTKEPHRIVGYAEKYVGKELKYICSFLAFASGYASLLLYIIAGGTFLSVLTLGAISPFWASILFWVVGVFILWRGLRVIAGAELFMTGLLLLALGVVIARGVPLAHVANLTPFNPAQLFLPYGVILFALTGAFAIPEMRPLLDNGKKYVWAIVAGSVVPAIVYVLFNFAIVGMTGAHTTAEAIDGIVPIVGRGVGWIGALAGFLAIATSYAAFGLNLKNMLIFDWHMKPIFATLLIAGLPGIFFLLGFQQFIAIMSVAGAIFGAAVSIIILIVFVRAKKLGDRIPAFSLGMPTFVVYTIIAAMAVAGLYQIIYWVH